MTDTPPIDRLIAIMARLRDPEDGCPWDLEQTFRTILPYTLEEAYEVAEAIEHEDMAALRDELGDLLLQVVFHARMAEEGGHFAFADVVAAICDKLIRRHPHVFGAAELADTAAIRVRWEQIKAAERAGAESGESNGILAGVARALPALVRAEKLQRRAARVGFDWDEVSAVFDKVEEELAECRATLAEHADQTERVHEIGDLLFSCVNLARHMGVDAEQALRAANQRFERRFAQVECGLRDQGLEPSLETREAMERHWTLAKAAERQV
ncbi:nucleoside triphosphate pyrophosphohydrolase [Allochromatium vinosum]|uniref:Nucleoside triphosphate pyrophosphohydrolase n=1 Tax=Allochromatium vinosum (strain ATCC 17899 / DSM 180 / NBRC 103801 / NCIMB 10441 / D) TaxID=572477 RepID=D3RQJ6_ALLVD|nr:nucleoside triphosphate pyrophosphohydrolase [Allochromatium vinosum]ADC63680.1 MazG family protein [Allochromatium vinosum DSM 180]